MTAKIKLNAASGGGSVSLKAPSTTTSNAAVELQLPVADGSADTFLKTDGSGNLAFAAAGGGKILQVVQTVKTDVFSTSINEGTVSGDVTGLTVSITPSSASNKILLDVRAVASVDGTVGLFGYFYKDGSLMSNAIGDASGSFARVSAGSQQGTILRTDRIDGLFLDTAGGTSAITYSIRLSSAYSPSSPSARNLFINKAGATNESYNNFKFARFISTITAMEVAA